MGRTRDAPRCAVLGRREHLHEPHRQRRTWMAIPGRAVVRMERVEVPVDRAGQCNSLLV